jgi:hypothetical protein
LFTTALDISTSKKYLSKDIVLKNFRKFVENFLQKNENTLAKVFFDVPGYAVLRGWRTGCVA